MPQLQLPVFPQGATNITREIGFIKRDGKITYFNGHLPVFVHDEDDLQTFRMITSQFVVTGLCRQVDIIRVFGLPERTVKRYVKLYRDKGVKGFYESSKKRGAVVLTLETLKHAQELINEGKQLKEVGQILGIKTNTLTKAINTGKLVQATKKKENT